MDPQHILCEVAEGICTITFNRSERRNALTVGMYNDVLAHLAAAEADDNVRVIVFTGAGASFTSGNDIADFVGTPPAGPESPVFKLLTALVDARKPLLAAVRGHAIGIGVTMLLHCDGVIAADDARFQLPFVNLGLCPEGGSSLLLPRLMGHARAAELLLYGEPFSAVQAHAIGIVNQVVQVDSLQPTILGRARALAEKPVVSLRLTKDLLKHGIREQVHEALAREGAFFVERLASPAATEAFTAFFEKRRPDFRAAGE